jgi:hypothetical protein
MRKVMPWLSSTFWYQPKVQARIILGQVQNCIRLAWRDTWMVWLIILNRMRGKHNTLSGPTKISSCLWKSGVPTRLERLIIERTLTELLERFTVRLVISIMMNRLQSAEHSPHRSNWGIHCFGTTYKGCNLYSTTIICTTTIYKVVYRLAVTWS